MKKLAEVTAFFGNTITTFIPGSDQSKYEKLNLITLTRDEPACMRIIGPWTRGLKTNIPKTMSPIPKDGVYPNI
jgi:hypothetical protein